MKRRTQSSFSYVINEPQVSSTSGNLNEPQVRSMNAATFNEPPGHRDRTESGSDFEGGTTDSTETPKATRACRARAWYVFLGGFT